ncbi:ATPase, T2SS/T4P/T4SS family [Leifsonia sp. TF02-11]|uniref:ATPase, T2SS/T4P/T4SS family n=1 Tax=Leifsonia sp. TF02-11 TaxID=2815212 RepID=UPI001AA0DC47|nr:ATPase, T2SS/T4P/T4SS family [Leifsonia sp. TF02-11]MBO1741046.1 Flp pilus assembly complex ATPase component TadA [Leifsonia sp. TF02-11]
MTLTIPDSFTTVDALAAPGGPASGTRGEQSFAEVAEMIRKREITDWKHEALIALARAGASDVHMVIDSATKALRIYTKFERERHDLIEYSAADGEARTIFNAIKAHASLGSQHKASEPVDGRILLPVNGYNYRARAVRFLLVDEGEKVILRLPQVGSVRPLDEFGMTAENSAALGRMLARRSGIVFAAGPTNEGKSSLLRAIVMEVRSQFGTIMSIEDPVEQLMDGVEQIEVNESNGAQAGFAAILEKIVRADPDLVVVGEVRDRDTARLAAQLADMGKLVLSTIHATDGVAALRRFVKLAEAEPLSMLDGVRGVVSQRLVRTLNRTGGQRRYSGMRSVHEIFTKTDSFIDAMIEGRSSTQLHAVADANSTKFATNLDQLIAEGVTDQAEAVRILGIEAR